VAANLKEASMMQPSMTTSRRGVQRGARAAAMTMTTVTTMMTAAALTAGCVATRISSNPPEELEVKATFVDTESPSDGKQAVAVQFFEKGTLLDLRSGATIRVNGVELPRTALGYVGRVPQLASGGTYAIEHSLDEEKVSMTVTVPARPVITAPLAGAQLVRRAAQLVEFAPGGGSNVQANATGPAGSQSVTGQPDSGMIQLDTSAVGVGAGTISIVREMTGKVSGTGFKDASFSYSIGKTHPVVWQ
jgi:hypothetical protein